MLDPLTRRVLANAQDKLIGKAMAEHCDKRVATVRKAIDREEKYLFKVLRARNTGGIMGGDIEGAFHRLRSALDKAQ